VIKDFNSYFNDIYGKDNPTHAYHVTSRKNLESIMKDGLEPRVPEDYGLDGDTKGIYLFRTKDDMGNALMNWFGERIEEWEEENGQDYDEVGLVINIKGLELIDSVEYEWISIDHISPDRIISTIEV
jgi:hypothetical protein